VVVVVWVKVVAAQEPLELQDKVTAVEMAQTTLAVGHLIEVVAEAAQEPLASAGLSVHRAQLMLVEAVME
jgi:hypothetical protein